MKVQYFTRNKQTRITQFEHEYRRTASLTSYTHAHFMCMSDNRSDFLGYTAFFPIQSSNSQYIWCLHHFPRKLFDFSQYFRMKRKNI